MESKCCRIATQHSDASDCRTGIEGGKSKGGGQTGILPDVRGMELQWKWNCKRPKDWRHIYTSVQLCEWCFIFSWLWLVLLHSMRLFLDMYQCICALHFRRDRARPKNSAATPLYVRYFRFQRASSRPKGKLLWEFFSILLPFSSRVECTGCGASNF